MLGNTSSGSRRDERRRRGDVVRVRAVAAGARRVDQILPPGPHREHVLAHRLGAARDLVRGLALDPERDEESAYLRLGCFAAHDRRHRLACLRAGEIAALDHGVQRVAHRKFLPSAGPSGVSTDSGWNCTPSTGSSRWRTPITSPSSLVAVTSSASGTRVAASEW